ncbi:hypothetical protein BC628DRAFT_1418179 [Trametes gibbosa]|nr:hypothetical protein BC628DRAFT_1418179 [Trametes gibbosa]
MFTGLVCIIVPSLLVLGRVAAADSTPTGIPFPFPSGGLSGLSACTRQCISEAATSSGCSTNLGDLQCICSNPDFMKDAGGCVQQKCPGDATAALQAFQALCGGSISATSETPSTTDPTSAASTATSTGTASLSASSSRSDDHDHHSGSLSSSLSPSAPTTQSTSLSLSAPSTASPSSDAAAPSSSPLSLTASAAVSPSTLTVAPAPNSASLASSSPLPSNLTSVPPAPGPGNSTASTPAQTHNAARGTRATDMRVSFGGVLGLGVALVCVALGAGFVL